MIPSNESLEKAVAWGNQYLYHNDINEVRVLLTLAQAKLDGELVEPMGVGEILRIIGKFAQPTVFKIPAVCADDFILLAKALTGKVGKQPIEDVDDGCALTCQELGLVKKENARLREALEKIMEVKYDYVDGGAIEVMRIAKTALGKEDKV